MKIVLFFSLIFIQIAYAEKLTLKELLLSSETNSPLLKSNQAKVSYADAAKNLANSYYFPVFNFTQRYAESTNPVQAFGMKLMSENFKMQDFAIDKLNNPDKAKAHQSSFNLFVPIDVFGAISAQKKVIQDQKESAKFEGEWIKKEIKKNIKSLYYAYFSIDDLKNFFLNEKIFLTKIIKLYDSKNDDNKNRYLSYNQARIILDSLQEGAETLEIEKSKILKELKYVTGVSDIELVRSEMTSQRPKDIISKGEERFDLISMQKYVNSLDAEVLKVKKNYLPELSLFGQYNLSSEKLSERTGKDTTIGAQLSWTFGASLFQNVALSRAKSLQAHYEYEDKDRRAKTDLSVQEEELEKLQTNLLHKENRHNIFVENKSILNFQYQRGSVELYNLLDNFISYIQNYSEYMKLKAEYQSKLALFEQNFKE